MTRIPTWVCLKAQARLFKARLFGPPFGRAF
jgi:hypothetical protein